MKKLLSKPNVALVAVLLGTILIVAGNPTGIVFLLGGAILN